MSLVALSNLSARCHDKDSQCFLRTLQKACSFHWEVACPWKCCIFHTLHEYISLVMEMKVELEMPRWPQVGNTSVAIYVSQAKCLRAGSIVGELVNHQVKSPTISTKYNLPLALALSRTWTEHAATFCATSCNIFPIYVKMLMVCT